MMIGIVRELNEEEDKVGLLPADVEALVVAGHTVLAETCCGSELNFEDEDYVAAGARVVSSAEEVFARCSLVVKVQEPLPCEWLLLRHGQTLLIHASLSASDALTHACRSSGTICLTSDQMPGERLSQVLALASE